jgi:diguanylate cyclase (GGDEF)-like protein
LVIRNNLKKELLKHKFNLFEAKDGQEALNFLKNKSVDLIITDYEMPNLDGLGLLKEIRKEKDKNILPIIALSSINNSAVVSRFLKNGANDYLTKPYSKDELMCRVNNAITNKELYEEIKQIATIDPLTKVYNRNYFYEASEQIFANAKRYNEDLSVAILDIDHFKKINDTYGHDVGDIVLKSVAKKMKKRLRGSDLLVRYGGEEFIILLPNTSLKKSFIAMEGLRETISKNKVEIDGEKIVVTVSIGISDIKDTNSLDEAIKRADLKLYKAKNNGRDRVEF